MKCKINRTFWRVPVIVICLSLLFPMLRSSECTYGVTQLYCGSATVRFHKEKNINIKYLTIVESDMRSLSAKDFGTFRNLTDLHIINSLFSYSKLEGFFALLTHVQRITIESSNISDDLGIMFPDNTKIRVLKMLKNNLRFIPKNFPRRFPFLQEIDLSDNKISQIDFLSSSNYTKSKPRSVLSNSPYLSSIYLRNNNISCLRNFTFTNLTKIENINLSFNQIEKIERIAFNISEGSYNARLNLSYNALTEVEDGTFSLCSRVTVLDLSSNRILRMHTHAFQGLSSLEELLLGNNKIVSIFPGHFGPLGSLRRLDLSDNAIFEIQDGAFARNYLLVDLRLPSNQLRQLTCDSFFNLTSLQTLNLSGNSMGRFRLADFSHLVNLETLSLDLHNGSECDCRVFKQMKEIGVKLNIRFTSLSDSCSIYWAHYLSANQHWGRECPEPVTADECQWGADKNASLGEEGATGGDGDGDGEGRSAGSEEWEGRVDPGAGGGEVASEREGDEWRDGKSIEQEEETEERGFVVDGGRDEGVGAEREGQDGEGRNGSDTGDERRGAEGAGVLVSEGGGRETLWMGLGAAGAALCVGVGAVAAWWLKRRRGSRWRRASASGLLAGEAHLTAAALAAAAPRQPISAPAPPPGGAAGPRLGGGRLPEAPSLELATARLKNRPSEELPKDVII